MSIWEYCWKVAGRDRECRDIRGFTKLRLGHDVGVAARAAIAGSLTS